MDRVEVNVRVKWRCCLCCYQRFALLHVLLFEEELSVQVGKIDGIEVEECYVTEACQDNVFDWRRVELALVSMKE